MTLGGQALNDPERLAALRAASLTGEVSLEALERISRLATRLLGVRTVVVNIVDDEHQTTVTGTSENPRFGTSNVTPISNSFCQHVVTGGERFVVTDARDDMRMVGNLGVTEDHVIAYLGVPLRAPTGHVLGALCALDDQPRVWSEDDQSAMDDLGGLIADQLQLRAATREIELLVNRDSLTGLGNRRYWEERAVVELRRAERQGEPLTVVMFDLDGFKAVNDTHGHVAGDEVLRELGERWRPLIRAPDVLVRWGGDEFACLLVGTSLTEARVAAERLAANRPQAVGVSFGLAQWTGDETLDALVARADANLYTVKRARQA